MARMNFKNGALLLFVLLFVLAGCEKKEEPQQEQVVVDYAYTDLGLPSGTLWATCNLGASHPYQLGFCFAWGETSPNATYTWSTYKYGSDYYLLTKYCNDPSRGLDGYHDTKAVLDPEDDAATVLAGSQWRIPTSDQLNELMTECEWEWTTLNDVKGLKMVGPNQKSLFFPAAGYRDDGGMNDVGVYGAYWSNGMNEESPACADFFEFSSIGPRMGVEWRCLGQSIRPVVAR